MKTSNSRTPRLIAAILGFALLGEASAALAKTPVNLWHAYRAQEKTALEEVAKKFNAENKDIELLLLPIPYDAFADKITAAVPRGKGPDLFIFAQDRVGDWAASGVVEPIDFWLTDELRTAFMPPSLEALSYDGQFYGLPMAVKMIALIYNKKLVKNPPKTTDELIQTAKALTKGGTFGLVYQNADFWYHGMWMQGFGGRVFDKKGAPTLDSKEVIDSMKFAQKLAHSSGIMPEEVSSTLVTTLFNQGKAAMVINGPWFIGELDKGVDYGVAALPKISDAGGKPAKPFLSAEGVIMSAKATDKKAAFEVMKYLTSVEAGRIMAKVGRQTAARKAVYDDPEIAKDPVLSVFRAQLADSVPTPNSPAMRMVWSPVTTAMNKIINGKGDAADSMKAAQAEVAKLVKGARR